MKLTPKEFLQTLETKIDIPIKTEVLEIILAQYVKHLEEEGVIRFTAPKPETLICFKCGYTSEDSLKFAYHKCPFRAAE